MLFVMGLFIGFIIGGIVVFLVAAYTMDKAFRR